MLACRSCSPGAGAYQWAELMGRTFGLDVLACPRCDGRLRLVALIEQASVVQRTRIRLRLLRALRRAKRGVGVRRRFPSRSAFFLALLRLLDENRLQTAALSALSKGEGLSRDRERQALVDSRV